MLSAGYISNLMLRTQHIFYKGVYMGFIQQEFTNNQTITITLASLADGATATSSTIDNSTTKYLHCDLQMKMRSGAGVSGSGTVTLYILRSADGGTTFDDIGVNTDIFGIFNVPDNSTDYVFSVDTSTIGILPEYWKLTVLNNTGDAFDSTGSNFSVKFVGKKLQTV